MILAKLTIWLLVIGVLLFQDLVKHKEPFDRSKKVFDFKLDYWQFRWDNVALSVLFSAISGLIASEVGGYAIVWALSSYAPDTQVEVIDGAFELTAVAACSYFIPKKILNEKD